MSESEARAFIDQLTCEERLTLYQFLKAMQKKESAIISNESAACLHPFNGCKQSLWEEVQKHEQEFW